LSDGEHRGRGIEITGENEAGHLTVGHFVHDFDLLGLRQHLEISHLSCTQNLNTFIREILEEAGEGQRRTVDAALADHAVQTAVAGHKLHLELLTVRFEKVGYGDALNSFRHGVVLGGKGNHHQGRACLASAHRVSLHIEIFAEVILAGLRVVDEELAGAFGEDFALADDVGAIDDTEGFTDIMVRNEDSDAAFFER